MTDYFAIINGYIVTAGNAYTPVAAVNHGYISDLHITASVCFQRTVAAAAAAVIFHRNYAVSRNCQIIAILGKYLSIGIRSVFKIYKGVILCYFNLTDEMPSAFDCYYVIIRPFFRLMRFGGKHHKSSVAIAVKLYGKILRRIYRYFNNLTDDTVINIKAARSYVDHFRCLVAFNFKHASAVYI